MQTRISWALVSGAIALLTLASTASAQSGVSFGRITAVTLVTDGNARAQAGGAVVGGGLGLISGSGQSGSNRTLRTVGGGLAGQQLARIGSNRQAFEYTILVDGTSTIRMVTDEGGLRVGDCVAVERGSFNNLRLVSDDRCAPAQGARAAAAPPAAVQEASACVQAKEQVLAAETEEAFNIAERRMRLLCAD
jgi:outer membrane lipoprotein SlyB